MGLDDRTIVLIPTYNEAGNIGEILDAVFAAVPKVRVLILDDSSPDGTAAIVRDKQEQYPRLSLLVRTANKGLGKSYQDGFRHVLAAGNTEVIITMDADFSHDPAEIPPLLQIITEGADAVIGSRHARGGRFPGIPLWRRVLSRGANLYVRQVLSIPIADCTSGFMAIRFSALAAIDVENVRSEGYGFLFEMKYRLSNAGFTIREHPVAWPQRHKGISKMSRRIMWESFLLPWKIRRSVREPGTAGAAR